MQSILLLVVMLLALYFITIRPESKRKKAAEEMRNNLRKGEKITTIGGMVGRVVQVNENTVVFETSDDRVRIEIAKWGIQTTESMEQANAQKGRKKAVSEKVDLTGKEEKKEEAKSCDPEIK